MIASKKRQLTRSRKASGQICQSLRLKFAIAQFACLGIGSIISEARIANGAWDGSSCWKQSQARSGSKLMYKAGRSLSGGGDMAAP